MFWFVFGHLRLQGERFPLYLWRFHGSSDVCLPSVVEPRKSRSNLWATRRSSAYHEGSAERREENFDKIDSGDPQCGIWHILNDLDVYTGVHYCREFCLEDKALFLGPEKHSTRCGPACRASVNAPHTSVGVSVCPVQNHSIVFELYIYIIIMVQGTLFQTCGAYI